MSAPYSTILIDPPPQEWVLQRCMPDVSALAALRSAARRRFVDASQQYVLRLQEIATRSGLPALGIPILTGDADAQPIVMTGHQPTIFHPGLVFKYQHTEHAAAAGGAIGAAIVIDTDEGDPGAFPFPTTTTVTPGEAADGRFATTTAWSSFGAAAALYPGCRLKTRQQQALQAEHVAESVRRSVGSDSSQAFLTAARQYAELTTHSMVEANLIVRRQHHIGSGLLELPLSAFAAFPETLQIAADVVSQATQFAAVHNQLLAEFRRDEKIRNAANPFPDLVVDADHCELPYWVFDLEKGRRQVASVRRNGQQWELLSEQECVLSWTGSPTVGLLESLGDSGLELVAGVLITALMRLLISDLFVHGTGGAKYDKFTDRLIQQWWQVRPAPFAVASASRYLMPRQMSRLAELDSIADQLRDLSHNPQRFLGTGIFSADLESRLREMTNDKQLAVEELKQRRASGQDARETGRRLQQLSDQIRTAVEQEFAPQMEERSAITKENRAAITSRTWPWFLFPGQS